MSYQYNQTTGSAHAPTIVDLLDANFVDESNVALQQWGNPVAPSTTQSTIQSQSQGGHLSQSMPGTSQQSFPHSAAPQEQIPYKQQVEPTFRQSSPASTNTMVVTPQNAPVAASSNSYHYDYNTSNSITTPPRNDFQDSNSYGYNSDPQNFNNNYQWDGSPYGTSDLYNSNPGDLQQQNRYFNGRPVKAKDAHLPDEVLRFKQNRKIRTVASACTGGAIGLATAGPVGAVAGAVGAYAAAKAVGKRRERKLIDRCHAKVANITPNDADYSPVHGAVST